MSNILADFVCFLWEFVMSSFCDDTVIKARKINGMSVQGLAALHAHAALFFRKKLRNCVIFCPARRRYSNGSSAGTFPYRRA